MAGRAWKQVRRMSKGERAELAKGLGIEGAEGLVERLASRTGRLSPAVMMQALEFAKENDEASIRDVLKRLGSSEGRKELLEEGIERLTAEAEPGPDPKLEPEAESTAPPNRRWVPRPKEVTVAGAAAAATAAKVRSTRPTPATPSIPAPSAGSAPKPPPAPAIAPAPTPTVSSAELSELHDPIPEQSGARDQLKSVRRAIARASSLTVDQARELLESLPSGWMRRRALNAMLEARVIGSFADATVLIESLESRASRRWCIGSLLSHWDIDEGQRSHLLHWRKTGERSFSGSAVG